MDNNLDNNQGGRRPDKGDPRRNQDPNRNKKNHQSILAFLICLLVLWCVSACLPICCRIIPVRLRMISLLTW